MNNDIGKNEVFRINTENIRLNTENVRINTVVSDKTWIIIGKDTGHEIKIGTPATFNWFQKKMWKFLLNIDIEDIK